MKAQKIVYFFILIVAAISFSSSTQATPALIDHTTGDLTSSFADWPIYILVGGVVTAVSVHSSDDEVQNYFTHHQISKKFDHISNWGGNPYILGGASVGMYGLSLLGQNDEFKKTSETLVEAMIFNAVMTEGLKFSFQRTRPNGEKYGFPSGHTSATFTIASVLQSMEGWHYGLPAYMIATAIGFSRLDGNYHYMSDVVFGAALGSFVGWGTSVFHKKEDTKLLISPIFDQTRGIMLSYKF